MNDWETPPTEDEKRAAGWDQPPTAAELADAGQPEPSTLEKVKAFAGRVVDAAPDATRKFFDPTYGTNRTNDLWPVAQGVLKAGGVAAGVAGGLGVAPLAASGFLLGLGSTDASDPQAALDEAEKSAAWSVVGGKVGQGIGKAAGLVDDAVRVGFRPSVTPELGDFVRQRVAQEVGQAPIIRLDRFPSQAQESEAVIKGIKEATQNVSLAKTSPAPLVRPISQSATEPVGAPSYSWTTPQNQSSTYSVTASPMSAPTPPEPIPFELPGAAGKVLPKGASDSASSKFLRDRGAILTVGQRNPATPVAQIEEASTSLPHVGQGIQNQRQVGEDSIRYVAFNAAKAPGAPKIRPSGDRWADLDKLAEGYSRAYDAFRGIEVYPAVHGPGGGPLQGVGDSPGLVSKAIDAFKQNTTINDDAVNAARVFVERKLTALPPRQGAVGKVEVGDLLKVRSDVRAEIRRLARSTNPQASDIKAALEAAEEPLTAAIESQLPAETAQALRAVDALYRNYKMVETAMWRAGMRPSGFTAHELESAVREVTSRGSFSRGHVGEMGEIVRAWKDVTQPITPKTGARAVVLDLVTPDKIGRARAMTQAQAIHAVNEQTMRGL